MSLKEKIRKVYIRSYKLKLCGFCGQEFKILTNHKCKSQPIERQIESLKEEILKLQAQLSILLELREFEKEVQELRKWK